MKRRLEALALGILRSPAGPVLAMAGLTLRESVRRKVFLTIAVFAVVMVGATALLPAIDPRDRVALIQTWAQRSITFFGVLISVFLAGVSLPEDIEEKRVFMLLTKPLSRWQLLTGRFAGFAGLLAVFLAATGLVSTGFIRVVAARSGGTISPVSEVRALQTRIEQEKPGSVVTAESSEAVPFFGTVRGEGETIAVWYFRNLDPSDFDDSVRLRYDFNLTGPGGVQFADLVFYLRPPAEETDTDAARALGWKVTFERQIVPGQPLPGRVAYRSETAKARVPGEIRIPKAWIRSGSIDVGVKRAKPSTNLDVESWNVSFLTRAHSFEMNFARGLMCTFLMWIVLLSITLAGSTFMTAPVNILFGVSVFVMGNMIGFIRESLPTVDERIVMATKADEEAVRHGHSHGETDDIPVPVLKASLAVSRAVMGLIPDLNAYDASGTMLRGLDVPGSRIRDNGLTALAFAGGALLIGIAALRLREFR
ncbi:MAG: ABC transporter permease [Candidatus Brocadiae bacterium]|nr:ABC transporter permease [Candidatus Brocadiia bacterium]